MSQQNSAEANPLAGLIGLVLAVFIMVPVLSALRGCQDSLQTFQKENNEFRAGILKDMDYGLKQQERSSQYRDDPEFREMVDRHRKDWEKHQ